MKILFWICALLIISIFFFSLQFESSLIKRICEASIPLIAGVFLIILTIKAKKEGWAKTSTTRLIISLVIIHTVLQGLITLTFY